MATQKETETARKMMEIATRLFDWKSIDSVIDQGQNDFIIEDTTGQHFLITVTEE